jgi:hypothetical protein
VLRLSRLRQRTATGGYIGSAPLTANCLRAGSSAHAVNAGDTRRGQLRAVPLRADLVQVADEQARAAPTAELACLPTAAAGPRP